MKRGLYIHIPFCLKKCKYCDFVSFENAENVQDEYVAALKGEMEQYAGAEVDTVFIGGGTPTALSPKLLRELLTSVRRFFRVDDNSEFTVEANPGTLTAEKLRTLKEGGVNRLSIGVQSFCDSELAAIGRIHRSEDAYNTICMAKKEGFSNINIDLMSALPQQTEESFLKTLELAAEAEAQHISCYSLILEDGTPLKTEFERGEFTLPDEDTDRLMYHRAVEFFEKHGYARYEISNFAKSGYECRHNIKYWECREYIGIGLAAHSYFEGERFSNTENMMAYIRGSRESGKREQLTRKDLISEFMMLGLRMTKGISDQEFCKRFGVPITGVFEKEIKYYTEAGFMQRTDFGYALTDKGIDVSNSVLCDFIL